MITSLKKSFFLALWKRHPQIAHILASSQLPVFPTGIMTYHSSLAPLVSSPCVQISSFYKNSSHIGLGSTDLSILAWRIPWTEEPGRYSPWGRKESDTTEWLNNNSFKCSHILRCISHFWQVRAWTYKSGENTIQPITEILKRCFIRAPKDLCNSVRHPYI